jgi:ParB-like chromosome segregation protein Spo0J
MKNELISVELLIPYARNSRTHSDEQVSQIAASIKEFGFLNPVIIDGDNGIIAGHGRVAYLMELDPKYCDVIIKRWQDFTGKEAIHDATGDKFNDMFINGRVGENGMAKA